MKRFIAIMMCVTILFLLGACNKNIFGSHPTMDARPSPSPTQGTEAASFDFQANGIIVQAQQYGTCLVQVHSENPHATVTVSGKNLCGGATGTDTPKNYNGITYVKQKDGSIVATGTATKNSVCYIAGKWGDNTTNADRIFLPEGTYTFSGCPAGGTSSTYRQRLAVVEEDGGITNYYDYGDGVTFTLWEGAYVGTCIQIFSEATVDLTFFPQIEIGNRVTEYELYHSKRYSVEITDGVGTLEIDLPEDTQNGMVYTFIGIGASLTVSGFGSILNCVQPLWHAAQPHFVIIDDDGKDEVYTILMPLLNGRGIPFATSVIPSKLGKTGYLTEEQLKAVAEAGNKVLCHGKNHRNLKNDATTYEERYEEIVGGKQMLADLGFDVDTMVYPNGSYDDEVLEITKAHYKYGIATSGDTPWGQQRYNEDPVNPYVIERVNIGSYYNGQTAEEKAAALEDAKRNVDICIEKNYLCVIMTHIGDAGEDGIAQIIELINYIESKGYSFVDLDTAIQAHIPPEQG